MLEDVPGWAEDTSTEFPTLKNQVAELVAALGGWEVVKKLNLCVEY